MGIETFIEGSKRFTNKNKKPLIFFTSATLLDAITSIVLLNDGGKELYPPAAFLVENLGVEGGIVLGKSGLYASALYFGNMAKDKAKYVLYGMGAPGAIAGVSNLAQIVYIFS